METAQLKEEVKQKMIQFLNLSPMKPEEIENEAPLFVEGLGLDSIDSLELIVMIKREYGIHIQDPKAARKIFANVNTMVDFIEKNRTT
jgi:acyl carrier protein